MCIYILCSCRSTFASDEYVLRGRPARPTTSAAMAFLPLPHANTHTNTDNSITVPDAIPQPPTICALGWCQLRVKTWRTRLIIKERN